MSEFFWTSSHLGWCIFALVVFTCLCLLLADLVWRLTRVGVRRLAVAMVSGWLIGFGFILLAFYLANR